MSPRPSPYRYGTPNGDLIRAWFELDPDDDVEFWALNLMRYREVADYADGRATELTGKEADDAYAPLGPLAAVGAVVAFHADVAEQVVGSPTWHRVGIVRYPSRAAFFTMQQRDDFAELHEHKDAGMEATIVVACHPGPLGAPAAGAAGDGTLVLTVERGGEAALPPGVALVATLDVEGVIVGDGRAWDRARVVRVPDAAAIEAVAVAAHRCDEAFVVVLAEPEIDALVASIVTAPHHEET